MGISPRSGEKIMGKKLWEFEILGVGKIMGISQSLKKTLYKRQAHGSKLYCGDI